METKSAILVIDDDETMLDSCSMILEKEGHTSLTAENGESGISLFQSKTPDLVLLDLKMPGKSGMEVLQTLKSINPDCVVIIITGYGTIQSAVDAMKYGAYDFLPKPFTPDELRFRIRRGLERYRYIRETAFLRKERERMRNNFVSMVSHELRSPLAVLQQNLMVMSGGLAGSLPESVQQTVLRMQVRIEAMLSLINDWLDLSRIESGEMLKDREAVDLAVVISDVIEMLRPLAGKKEVTLEFTAQKDLYVTEGSRSLLSILFNNLVNNGIKYNRPGGRVTLEIGITDTMITISVSDTGIGIPEDKLPLIFDQFYRVKESTEETGSGLGLSIVKSIVDAHHGTINVASKAGEWTRFTICLPALHIDKVHGAPST
jgi:two-component system sensor histidine kinase/response regulator